MQTERPRSPNTDEKPILQQVRFSSLSEQKKTSSPGIMVLNSFTANGDRLQMFGMGSKTDKSHSLKDLFYDLPSQATNLIMVQRKRCCNGFSPMITKFGLDNLYHGKRHRKKKSGLEVLFDTTWSMISIHLMRSVSMVKKLSLPFGIAWCASRTYLVTYRTKRAHTQIITEPSLMVFQSSFVYLFGRIHTMNCNRRWNLVIGVKIIQNAMVMITFGKRKNFEPI